MCLDSRSGQFVREPHFREASAVGRKQGESSFDHLSPGWVQDGPPEVDLSCEPLH